MTDKEYTFRLMEEGELEEAEGSEEKKTPEGEEEKTEGEKEEEKTESN